MKDGKSLRHYLKPWSLRTDSREFLEARDAAVRELQKTCAGLSPDDIETIAMSAFFLGAKFGFTQGLKLGEMLGWEAGKEDGCDGAFDDWRNYDQLKKLEKENQADIEAFKAIAYTESKE